MSSKKPESHSSRTSLVRPSGVKGWPGALAEVGDDVVLGDAAVAGHLDRGDGLAARELDGGRREGRRARRDLFGRGRARGARSARHRRPRWRWHSARPPSIAGPRARRHLRPRRGTSANSSARKAMVSQAHRRRCWDHRVNRQVAAGHRLSAFDRALGHSEPAVASGYCKGPGPSGLRGPSVQVGARSAGLSPLKGELAALARPGGECPGFSAVPRNLTYVQCDRYLSGHEPSDGTREAGPRDSRAVLPEKTRTRRPPRSRRAAPPPSRWRRSSARSPSPSSSPRTATCSASTTPRRRCSPPSRRRSTTRSTPARRPASCPSCHRGPRPGLEAGRRAHQGRGPLPGGGRGQRPGHRQGPGPEDLRQAALRLEVPPPEAVARPAGHRHLRGGHVRPAHHRQADPRHPRTGKGRPAHASTSSIDTRKNEPVVVTDETLASGTRSTARGSSSRSSADWQQGQRFVNRYVEHTALANPHADRSTYRAPPRRSELQRLSRAPPTSCPRRRSRSSRTRTASSWAAAHDDAGRRRATTCRRLPADDRFSPRLARRWREILAKVATSREQEAPRSARTGRWPRSCTRHRRDEAHGPPTNCLSPIGDELMKGLVSFLNVIESEGARARTRSSTSTGGMKRRRRRKAQGEPAPAKRSRRPPEEGVEKIKGHNYFIATVTRPPKVYRGNPFQVEVRPRLRRRAGRPTRRSSSSASRTACRCSSSAAPAASPRRSCAPTGATTCSASPRARCRSGRWRSSSTSPRVWVPFTSESKEAVAHYPEIIKEIQLAAQECGRKLATFIRKRKARRLPGAAAQHLRALHRGGGAAPSARSRARARTASRGSSSRWPHKVTGGGDGGGGEGARGARGRRAAEREGARRGAADGRRTE